MPIELEEVTRGEDRVIGLASERGPPGADLPGADARDTGVFVEDLLQLARLVSTPSVAEQTVSGTGIALSTGVWTHVAVTRSGTTVSLYVDGSLAASGTIALSPSDLGITTQNHLGKSQWNDPYIDGALDDFRIYS